jgi:competence ComEA-like helix-hairpin-helix protein
MAERFTRNQLVRPFTVRTCFQDARGRSRLPRSFAFVEIDHSDLGESLVANGLARVHGASARAPEMNSPGTEWRKLERLERQAKAAHLGAWGMASNKRGYRAVDQPLSGDDYFRSFFHPLPTQRSIAGIAESGTKLDINHASAEELQAIHGIGPVLAGRIIAARPFKTADELQKIKGIKDKKYAELRPSFQ